MPDGRATSNRVAHWEPWALVLALAGWAIYAAVVDDWFAALGWLSAANLARLRT